MQKNQPLFTISVAAKLLNTHPRTLMSYEREKLIHPFRSDTKRRLFSRIDLEEIQFLQFLTQKKGLNIAGVKLILAAIGKAKEYNLDLIQALFPEFKAKELI